MGGQADREPAARATSRSSPAPPRPPPRRRERHRSCPGKLLHSPGRTRATNELRSRDSCNTTMCADPSAERDLSTPLPDPTQPEPVTLGGLDIAHTFKETS